MFAVQGQLTVNCCLVLSSTVGVRDGVRREGYVGCEMGCGEEGM